MFRFYYMDVQMHSFSNSLDLEVDSKIVFYNNNNNNNNNCTYSVLMYHNKVHTSVVL